MKSNQMIIALLVILVGAVGYYIYQDQQKEKVSISIGGKELSIEAD